MGTRSVVLIMDDNEELCRIYRQFDGYPEGMGLDLAKACNRKLTNGITGRVHPRDAKEYITSNGMRELATQVIVALKTASPVGNIYLEVPNGSICEWAEFVYMVRGEEGSYPTIECSTHTDPNGPSWFNPKSTDELVFKGTPEEWIAKYEEKKPAAPSKKRRATKDFAI